MAEHWVCIFEGRAGGRARAVFGTRQHAIEFAERIARSMTPPGVPLTWDHTNASAAVLTTQVGTYRVAPIGEEPWHQ